MPIIIHVSQKIRPARDPRPFWSTCLSLLFSESRLQVGIQLITYNFYTKIPDPVSNFCSCYFQQFRDEYLKYLELDHLSGISEFIACNISRRSSLSQPDRDVTTFQPDKDITTSQPDRDVTTSQPDKDITTSQPDRDVTMSEPDKDVTMSEPDRDVTMSEPDRDVTMSEPDRDVTMS